MKFDESFTDRFTDKVSNRVDAYNLPNLNKKNSHLY